MICWTLSSSDHSCSRLKFLANLMSWSPTSKMSTQKDRLPWTGIRLKWSRRPSKSCPLDFLPKRPCMFMADILRTDIMPAFQDLPFLRRRIDRLRSLGKITFLGHIFCLLISAILSSHQRLLLNKCLLSLMLMVLLPTPHLMASLKPTGHKKAWKQQAIAQKSHAHQIKQSITTRTNKTLPTIGTMITQSESQG